ncbi:MAG: IPT/TIG domain-containing protein, partial [Ignavibacteria bacterium]|nr:IPT/TIG domain-containing protein [Ignavibacteria bacterium]
GGTTLTISGQSFSQSVQYPIVVNVAGQACTILNVSLTEIQCKTHSVPSVILSQYQG